MRRKMYKPQEWPKKGKKYKSATQEKLNSIDKAWLKKIFNKFLP
jgi:hypothetical protein